MKTSEIYEKYKIIPNLRTHMLLVAGVAEIIGDNFTKELDKDSIIKACLLHDLGNIVKFDLYDTTFSKKLDTNYWKKIQSETIKRYGNDDHSATLKIIKEIGAGQSVIDLVESFGFGNVEKLLKKHVYNNMVCVYSDMRTSPAGVTSLRKRLEDAKRRYVYIKKVHTSESFDRLRGFWFDIEKQIFIYCKIKPEDITEAKIDINLSKFLKYEI